MANSVWPYWPSSRSNAECGLSVFDLLNCNDKSTVLDLFSSKKGENIPFSFHFLSPGLTVARKKESSVNACLQRVTHEVCRSLKVCKYVPALEISPASCCRGPRRSLGCLRTDGSVSLSLFVRSPSLSVTRLVVTELGGWWSQVCRETPPNVRDLSSFRAEDVFFVPRDS